MRMMRRSWWCGATALWFVLAVGSAEVQAQTQAPAPRDAAFLFAYRIKPGQGAAFSEGYRRHLDWHKAHGDSLPWLAWTVADGPNAGVFVDGTFGISHRSFDLRVDPRGDAEDAMTNVLAFADPIWREEYRVRPDLSAATRLETGRAGRLQQVTRIEVRPRDRGRFEAAARAFRRLSGAAADYAVYELISGGATGTYLIVTQLAGFADYADPTTLPAARLLRDAGDTIERAESTTWQYRPDLTLIPGRSP